MADLVDSIGRNFERLLRWVYPGAFFLVLLRLSNRSAYDNLLKVEPELWALVVAGIVAGVVVYLLQGYVLNMGLSILVTRIGWDVNAREGNENPSWWPTCLDRLAHLFDRIAQGTKRRWGGMNRQGLGNYLNYAWATYHATSITGWLTLVFYYFVKDDSSVLAKLPFWAIPFPAILLVLGSLLTWCHLSRVPFGSEDSYAVDY